MGAAVGVSGMGVSMVYVGPASQGGSQDPERRCGGKCTALRARLGADLKGKAGFRCRQRSRVQWGPGGS